MIGMNEACMLTPDRESVGARTERLLREYAAPLARLAASYARNESERDDLLQDIAVGLWRALPSFREECSERTLLFRIAHNRALSLLTRRSRAPTLAPLDGAHDVAASSGRNPAMVYERREHGQRLLGAVRALPLAQRQVLLLVLEGLSHLEIADVLGVTENVVAVRANRARAALRILLDSTTPEDHHDER